MEIHLSGRVADVELVAKDGNRVELTIDGKPYTVDIVMAENGSCSILHDGNSYNAELVRGDGGRTYDVSMYNRAFHIDIIDTQAKYLRLRKSPAEQQSDRLVAPMAGKVVSIPVAEGDRLDQGDVAIVLEAMKMQSNYKVSAPCRVRRLLVAEGDSVQGNQVLMEFDLERTTR